MQVEPVSPRTTWSRRKKAAVAVLGVIVLLALAGAAFVAIFAAVLRQGM